MVLGEVMPRSVARKLNWMMGIMKHSMDSASAIEIQMDWVHLKSVGGAGAWPLCAALSAGSNISMNTGSTSNQPPV